jgi:hypothetical protein
MFVSIACGSPSPSPAPTSTTPPSPALLPLPANLSGIPTDEEFTAEVSPQTPDGELAVGEERDYTLGHCGLSSPVDIDGSLWDPIGTAAALTEQQQGELINATPVIVVLVDESTMHMRTPAGALITLARHDGPRRYFLCD